MVFFGCASLRLVVAPFLHKGGEVYNFHRVVKELVGLGISIFLFYLIQGKQFEPWWVSHFGGFFD